MDPPFLCKLPDRAMKHFLHRAHICGKVGQHDLKYCHNKWHLNNNCQKMTQKFCLGSKSERVVHGGKVKKSVLISAVQIV